MLKNYFTLAIKVLGRNKFFTFISLFGVSFTLMILMLTTAYFEAEMGANAPLSKKDQMVFIDMMGTFREFQDTIIVIDTSMVDNVEQYDTTYTFEDGGRSMSRSSISFEFIDKYMRDIPSVENYSFYSPRGSFDIFMKSNKLTFQSTYTDAAFWQIFDFEFLSGRPYGETQVANQALVAVLSKKSCKEYFGVDKDFDDVLGKTITLEKKDYEVVGVIDEVRNSFGFLNADVFLAYTNMNPLQLNREGFLGPFNICFMGENPSKVKIIKEELVKKRSIIPLPNPDEHNQLEYYPATFNEKYSDSIIREDDPQTSYKYAKGILAFLLSLFFLLPTLNLINLNVSRIMERSSEIGVRKAFGAHSGNILFQFVFENIILTVIGGVIGFVLALLLIKIVNDAKVLEDTILSFNYVVFLYSVLICLVFGVLSGLIPAYRMSRLHIVNAIKNNQL